MKHCTIRLKLYEISVTEGMTILRPTWTHLKQNSLLAVLFNILFLNYCAKLDVDFWEKFF